MIIARYKVTIPDEPDWAGITDIEEKYERVLKAYFAITLTYVPQSLKYMSLRLMTCTVRLASPSFSHEDDSDIVLSSTLKPLMTHCMPLLNEEMHLHCRVRSLCPASLHNGVSTLEKPESAIYRYGLCMAVIDP